MTRPISFQAIPLIVAKPAECIINFGADENIGKKIKRTDNWVVKKNFAKKLYRSVVQREETNVGKKGEKYDHNMDKLFDLVLFKSNFFLFLTFCFAGDISQIPFS